METKLIRVQEIEAFLTPSHQSDIFDTFMCRIKSFGDKMPLGDCEYKGYHYKYENKELSYIKEFKINMLEFFQKDGEIQSAKNKTYFIFPEELVSSRYVNRTYLYFPLFVCKVEFSRSNRYKTYLEEGITINDVKICCYYDRDNFIRDAKEYIRKCDEEFKKRWC